MTSASGGLQAIRSLNVRQYPKLQSASVVVSTVYLGANADLVRGYRQADLARRSGLSLPTIKRFEATGHASLANALRIATALGAEESFQTLFQAPKFRSLDEALSTESAAKRRRIRSPR